MKKIAFFSLLFLLAGTLALSAQTHPVKVSVVNTKGKPIPGKALISLQSAPPYQRLDKDGTLTVQALPNDSVFVTVDRYVGSVPVDPTTSEVSVAVDKDKMYKAEGGKATSLAYSVFTLPPFNPNNIAAMPNIGSYSDLLNFVEARFPTLTFHNGDLYMLTMISSQAAAKKQGDPSTTAPVLIVLDGTPQRDFASVAERIRPSELKSFVVKKADAMYGTRGACGVIEITLKKGGE